MTTTKATAIHSKVKRLLEKGEIHDACGLLSSVLTQKSNSVLLDLIKKQEETYKYLLHYFVEGYTDGSRKKMLAEISAVLQFINDSILRNEVIFDSSDIYSSTLRFEKIRKASLDSRIKEFTDAYSLALLSMAAGGDKEISAKADNALAALFNYVWTMFGSSSDDYKALTSAVNDQNMPFEFKAQVISALLLGNLSWFDRKGFSVLLDIFEADYSPQLSARALTSIIMISAAHRDIIASDPELINRLALWKDSDILYRKLREVVMTIIRAHDTQRITSKMQNEVFPQLMKLRPDLIKRLGKISEISDLESLEENPEWEELLNNNGLGDKLKELTEMQLEGGDVMMMAFSNLKSFPFFNSVSNWFLPFNNSHNEVLAVTGNERNMFGELLESEGIMCDSDKFSFIFSLASMPENQRKMINSQMEAQLEQLKDVLADRKLKSSIPEFEQEVTRYVRNIYRFFKLFRKKTDFVDPFVAPLDFISLPVIGEILADGDILNLVGEFYFKRGYYKEALPILLRLEKNSGGGHLIWEKIGYCYNASGQLERALEWYSKAELLNPDSLWLTKKLALVNRLLNNYVAASDYYSKAVNMDPENFQLLMNLGHTLLQSGRPQESLSHYYHAAYLRPEKISAERAIAWAELLSGNTSKSIDIYKRIIEKDECKASDYLNLGHAYCLNNCYKDALNAYKKTLSFEGYDSESLGKSMEEDLPELIKVGAEPDILHLLLEKVKVDRLS